MKKFGHASRILLFLKRFAHFLSIDKELIKNQSINDKISFGPSITPCLFFLLSISDFLSYFPLAYVLFVYGFLFYLYTIRVVF